MKAVSAHDAEESKVEELLKEIEDFSLSRLIKLLWILKCVTLKEVEFVVRGEPSDYY